MDQSRDPRQQSKHPFSRNLTSPYGQTSFPPTPNRAAFPASSHPPSTASSYSEHDRRQSDTPYYNQPRYGHEIPPSHSRHQSGSSVAHGTSVSRNMPPPSSPQQHASQGPRQNYGPSTRPSPVSVGPPPSFPTSRELPTLPPIAGRPGGSGMSIADILGGPSRESQSSQYNSPSTSSGSTSVFVPAHTSPRASSSRPEYQPFRRPQTPDHQRQFETRDTRTNSAGSPVGMVQYATPESQRYSTPQQSYVKRSAVHEERRERPRTSNLNAPPPPPPRPSSQPVVFHGPPPPREADRAHIHGGPVFGRRVDTVPRSGDTLDRSRESNYGRPAFEERHSSYAYAAREQREREIRERELREQRDRERDAAIQRDRERENQIVMQRDREQREMADQETLQREYAHQVAQRNAAYSRAPEPRERSAWIQHGMYEPPRPAYEPIPEREPPPTRHQSNGYEYPVTTAPPYGKQPAYSTSEAQYGPPASMSHENSKPSASQYEATQDQQRAAQQQNQHQPIYNGPPQGPYQPQESPGRRPVEEPQPIQQQRNFLGVQEINRKGRLSPLPQAVQGAQGQVNGPGGEPSIKNEFGRMFSGIGSGVGSGLQAPSPVSGAHSGVRREDLETFQELQSLHKKQPASQGPKRRKLKEEDRGDDESSTGRNTPSGRVKRAKTGHNATHHTAHHHHHHRRIDPTDHASSPSQLQLTPFKSAKGAAIPSPQDAEGKPSLGLHHHHVPRHHHHHHHQYSTPNKIPQPSHHQEIPSIIPLPKTSIVNVAVLSSIAPFPRHHLGHAYYRSKLNTVSQNPLRRDFDSTRGFASTPDSLPLFKGRENCTFTVKIPPVYLAEFSREEITSRRALWGTDVYTDDSDVVAACIHGGWFRGAWSEDVDVSLLGLELKRDVNGDPIPPDGISEGKLIEQPSEKGPGNSPTGCECHVTIVIAPQLESYASSTRFGIKSREWGVKRDGWKGIHDGLSFMIKSVRFVRGVDGEEGRSGKSRRTIMQRMLQERAPFDIGGPNNGLPSCDQMDFDRKTSMSSDTDQHTIGLKGLGIGGWYQNMSDLHRKAKSNASQSQSPLQPREVKPTVSRPRTGSAREAVDVILQALGVQNGKKATREKFPADSLPSEPPPRPVIQGRPTCLTDSPPQTAKTITKVVAIMTRNANQGCPIAA